MLRRIAVISSGLVLVGSSVGLSRLASHHTPSAVDLTLTQIVAGAAYLIAAFLVIRKKTPVSIPLVLAVGVICRLILIPTAPLFDDDIHRYLWDGKVMSHGIDPFLYPPLSDHLTELRDENWTHVGYPTIGTIYPPGAEMLFGLAYAAGVRSVTGLKVIFLIFDLACMGLILALLGRFGRPGSWVLIYAWSPLAIKEFANSGHLEPVMLFFLLAAILAWAKWGPKSILAYIGFGLAVVVKLVPLLLVPIVFRLGKWRALAISGLAVVLFYLPFLGAGKLLFSGAAAYARYWTFNGSIFALLSGLERVLGYNEPIQFSPARLIVTSATVIAAVIFARRMDKSDLMSPVKTTRNVFAAALLLMPTVDPWYVCWLVPFLCIAPNPGLLLFTITCNLSYLYYAHNSFPAWIPIAEYLPVYILLALSLYRKRRPS